MLKHTIISTLILCSISLAPEKLFSQEKIVIAAVGGSLDKHVGIAVLTEAYKRIGYEIETVDYDGKEALKASNSGKVDGELQRIDGIDRLFTNLIQIQIPINYIQVYAFSKNISFVTDGWFSLRTYKIGIVRGILFAEIGTRGMDVVKTNSYEDLINLLLNDDIDLAIMPLIIGRVLLKKMNVEIIKPLPGVLETMFLYHYLHIKNKHLVKVLEGVLQKMLLNGTTRRLKDTTNERLIKDVE